MTKLLTIDPGRSTGFVLFNSLKPLHVEVSGVISENDLASWVSSIRPRLDENSHVVIERIPTPALGSLGRTLGYVLGVLELAFPNATYILPGHWKPVTQFVKTPTDLSIIHQRDAYRMGWYYLNFRMRTPWLQK